MNEIVIYEGWTAVERLYLTSHSDAARLAQWTHRYLQEQGSEPTARWTERYGIETFEIFAHRNGSADSIQLLISRTEGTRWGRPALFINGKRKRGTRSDLQIAIKVYGRARWEV
jgi:hypothetical protein